MKKIRTRNFFLALKIVLGFSAAFLLFMLMLGQRLAAEHFDDMAMGAFSVFAVASMSFLAICFLPYFKGDRRWFSIPAILTSVFFVSLVILWNCPMPGAVV